VSWNSEWASMPGYRYPGAFMRTDRNLRTLLEYHRRVRRLLQIGTFVFLLVTFLAPLSECFDRWDRPGISNDTEFAVFALVFAFCLVLVVSVLLSARSLLGKLVLGCVAQYSSDERLPIGEKLLFGIFIPPRLLPLRI
jgi:hypothetical protein